MTSAGRRAGGFTLVEAIIAITIIAVLGSMVSVFIRAPIQSYLDTSERAALADAADATVRRVARDVQAALPNSFRGTAGGSASCFEFLPVVAGGRYRVEKDAAGDAADDPLDFSQADSSFDVLAHHGLDATWASGAYRAVIYNLGITGADAYAGDTTAAISQVTAAAGAAAGAASEASRRIVLGAAKQFPLQSPGRRFQVIPAYAVVYSCSGTALYRSTRTISASPLATCPTGGELLTSGVNCANSGFSFEPAVTRRNGILTISLELVSPSGESVRLYDQVGVSNVP